MSDCFDHESDAWDSLIFGRDSEEPDGSVSLNKHRYYKSLRDIDRPPRKNCKFCNQPVSHWDKLEAGWRLRNYDGTIHSCNEARYYYNLMKDNHGGRQQRLWRHLR